MKTSNCLHLIIAGILAVTAAGCSPGKNEVAGNYRRADRGVIETLDLKADGSFKQIVSYEDGHSWAVEGLWSLVKGVVRLDKCYVQYDFEKDATVEPPRLVSRNDLVWKAGQIFTNELDKHPLSKS